MKIIKLSIVVLQWTCCFSPSYLNKEAKSKQVNCRERERQKKVKEHTQISKRVIEHITVYVFDEFVIQLIILHLLYHFTTFYVFVYLVFIVFYLTLSRLILLVTVPTCFALTFVFVCVVFVVVWLHSHIYYLEIVFGYWLQSKTVLNLWKNQEMQTHH